MAKSAMFEIVENNKKEILDGLEEAIPRALTAVGLKAAGNAKRKCPVDTGLLRNSITFAIAGEPAAIKTYTAKKKKTKKGEKAVGFYEGSSPPMEDTVYIGTNVEYAPYVEYGHMLPGGNPVPGEHFLEDAINGHKKQYEKLAEAALKGFK